MGEQQESGAQDRRLHLLEVEKNYMLGTGASEVCVGDRKVIQGSWHVKMIRYLVKKCVHG